MSGLDWRGLLEMALARGLTPAAFWAMTPAEFAALTGRGETGPTPMTRAGMGDLMAAFPDRKGEPRDG